MSIYLNKITHVDTQKDRIFINETGKIYCEYQKQKRRNLVCQGRLGPSENGNGRRVTGALSFLKGYFDNAEADEFVSLVNGPCVVQKI